MGGNIIFSSYRKEKEDIYFSSFWLPVITILFGLLCAIINFSYLGHFSYLVNIPIEKLPLSGTDLAFTTYPSALCMLPFPNFWSIIFFFILKLICLIGFVLGLPFVMEGGFYLFELVDDYASNVCFLIAFLECFIFNKYLGEDTIKVLIKKKTGKDIPQYVYDSINKFAPYSLISLFILCSFNSVKFF